MPNPTDNARETHSLNIAEIFYSIQGEGYWTGTPMVFIRTAGCNRKCTFCDTNHETKETLGVKEILKRVDELNPLARVCITGGEPTIQKNFHKLVETLNKAGKQVHVETYKGISKDMIHTPFWVTISPKDHTEAQFLNLLIDVKNAFWVNELKILVGGEENIYWRRIIDTGFIIPNRVFLQPIKDSHYRHNLHRAIKLVEQYPTLFRLSAQLHMLLSLP